MFIIVLYYYQHLTITAEKVTTENKNDNYSKQLLTSQNEIKQLKNVLTARFPCFTKALLNRNSTNENTCCHFVDNLTGLSSNLLQLQL